MNQGSRESLGSSGTWLGVSKLLLQPRARAGICAQPGHGTICHRESKTHDRADFGFQKSLQLSQAGLESTDTGKKGNQRGSAASRQELQAHGLVLFPQHGVRAWKVANAGAFETLALWDNDRGAGTPWGSQGELHT